VSNSWSDDLDLDVEIGSLGKALASEADALGQFLGAKMLSFRGAGGREARDLQAWQPNPVPTTVSMTPADAADVELDGLGVSQQVEVGLAEIGFMR
jgi:hypothetical protein